MKQYGSTGTLPQLMIYKRVCTFRTRANVRGSDGQLWNRWQAVGNLSNVTKPGTVLFS